MYGIYTNAQGLLNNLNKIEIIMELRNPEFIILSETHLTNDVEENEYQLLNYKHYVTLSNSSRTGGVLLYIKREWKVEKLHEKVANSKYWMSAYKVENKSTILIIMAVYRSPACREVEFCEAFDEITENICETNLEIIIAGDFNIDWRKNNTYKNRIQATLNDNGLNQIVTEYTRVTENTKTLIDFVITNSINVSAKNNGENKIADHEAIDINIKNKNFIESTKKEIEIFKYNKNLFRTEVRKNTDKNENKSLSEMTYNIDNCLENAIKNSQ